MSRIACSAVVLVCALVACSGDRITELPPLETAFVINDGAHGGVDGFFWLTPTVKRSVKHFAGEFDGDLVASVRLHICRINGATPAHPDECAAIRHLSGSSQPEIIRVDAEAENYSVTWQSTAENGTTIGVGDRLRAFAHVPLPGGSANAMLGFVDMIAVASQREVSRTAADLSGFVPGTPFVFKFRIEKGIAGSIAVDPPGQMVLDGATGESAAYTATLLDLHGAPMTGVDVGWSSSQPGIAGVNPPTSATGPLGVSHASATTVGRAIVATPTDVVISASFAGLSDSETLVVSPTANPAIDIEKATNGVDADDPSAGDAPQIAIGDAVVWSYLVTNTGDVPLVGVVVTDDQGVAVSCPQTSLAIGESMTCSGTGAAVDVSNTGFTTVSGVCGGTAGAALYENIGTATGETSAGAFVQDADPSHYCNPHI